jgi:hypothetical protein
MASIDPIQGVLVNYSIRLRISMDIKDMSSEAIGDYIVANGTGLVVLRKILNKPVLADAKLVTVADFLTRMSDNNWYERPLMKREFLKRLGGKS